MKGEFHATKCSLSNSPPPLHAILRVNLGSLDPPMVAPPNDRVRPSARHPRNGNFWRSVAVRLFLQAHSGPCARCTPWRDLCDPSPSSVGVGPTPLQQSRPLNTSSGPTRAAFIMSTRKMMASCSRIVLFGQCGRGRGPCTPLRRLMGNSATTDRLATVAGRTDCLVIN